MQTLTGDKNKSFTLLKMTKMIKLGFWGSITFCPVQILLDPLIESNQV